MTMHEAVLQLDVMIEGENAEKKILDRLEILYGGKVAGKV